MQPKFIVFFRLCFAATLAVLAVGCAAPLTTPSALKPVTPSRDLVLSQPIIFKYTSGLSVDREIALLPGTYHGVGDDGNGIWYLAVQRTMSNTVTDRGGAIGFPKERVGVPEFDRGGLFVPNDPAMRPQVFNIYGAFRVDSTAVQSGQSDAVVSGVALNAQATTPALSHASVGQSAVGAGVASGMVAGLIALDQADWGKFRLFPAQPAPEMDLRAKFTIVTQP